MLFKAVAHALSSTKLDSRTRAVRQNFAKLELEQQDALARLSAQSQLIQGDLMARWDNRSAELDSRVTTLNASLASFRDLVLALQDVGQQAFCAVDIWLDRQLHQSRIMKADRRLALLHEEFEFLNRAEHALRQLDDSRDRRRWRQMQRPIEGVKDSCVATAHRFLREQRLTIYRRNTEIELSLKRLQSQRQWLRRTLSHCKTDRFELIATIQRDGSRLRQQRSNVRDSFNRALESWKQTPLQIAIGELVYWADKVREAHAKKIYVGFDRMKESRDKAYRKTTVVRKELATYNLDDQLNPYEFIGRVYSDVVETTREDRSYWDAIGISTKAIPRPEVVRGHDSSS